MGMVSIGCTLLQLTHPGAKAHGHEKELVWQGRMGKSDRAVADCVPGALQQDDSCCDRRHATKPS